MRPAGPRGAAVAALVHQEQGGYANLVLDAELMEMPLETPKTEDTAATKGGRK